MSFLYFIPSQVICLRSSYKYFFALDRVEAERVRLNTAPFVFVHKFSPDFWIFINWILSKSSIFSKPLIVLNPCLARVKVYEFLFLYCSVKYSFLIYKVIGIFNSRIQNVIIAEILYCKNKEEINPIPTDTEKQFANI